MSNWNLSGPDHIRRLGYLRRELDVRDVKLPGAVQIAVEQFDAVAAARPVQPDAAAVQAAIADEAEPQEVERLLIAEITFSRHQAAHSAALKTVAAQALTAVRENADELHAALAALAEPQIDHLEQVAALGAVTLLDLIRDGRHSDAELVAHAEAVAAEFEALSVLRDEFLATGIDSLPAAVNRWRDPRPVERLNHPEAQTFGGLYCRGLQAGAELWYPNADEIAEAAAAVLAGRRAAAERQQEIHRSQGHTVAVMPG